MAALHEEQDGARAGTGDPSEPPAAPQDAAAPEPHPDLRAGVPGRHVSSHGQSFGRVVGWTLLGSLVPGLGLLAAGRRRSGQVLLVMTLLVLATAGVLALVVDPLAVGRRWIGDPDRFLVAAAILVGLVVVWAVLVVLTHLALQRDADLTARQRILGIVLVASLVPVGAAPAAVATTDAWAARNALQAVFGGRGGQLADRQAPELTQPDPWASIPRMNVLLMGGDAGADRTGIRPDTMIVASLDTRTGDTVLVSLPRNLQRVPFPAGSRAASEFPDGFQCVGPTGVNTECLLNGLWSWGDEHPQDYPGDPHPGLTATIEGAEQATGLRISDYVMLDLRGFETLVDALGGLTVTVTERLPVGGSVEHPVASSWLEPGRQKLNGYLTLWYARSRWSTTDYDRMRRQRCVIGSLVRQIDPVTVALRFPKIAGALQQNLRTSIPLHDLDAWVTLAERVKGAHVRSLAFTDKVINTVHPDFDRMHELVRQALATPSSPSATSSPSSPSATSGAPTGTPTPATSTSTAPSTAEDLSQVC